MQRTRIYTPTGEPMPVLVFFSEGGSAGLYMHDHPAHGTKYKIAGAVTDNPNASGIQKYKKRGVPVICFNRRAFYETQRGADGESTRQFFYEHVLEGLQREGLRWAWGVLSGWMHIVSYPFIDSHAHRGEMQNKLFNGHPADLAILKAGAPTAQLNVTTWENTTARLFMKGRGARRAYTGGHGVHDAVKAGEREICFTGHLVNDEVDGGPILVRSPPISVAHIGVARYMKRGKEAAVDKYCDVLQEELKWVGDGPCYTYATSLVADGRIEIGDDNFTLFMDVAETPYGGIQLPPDFKRIDERRLPE